MKVMGCDCSSYSIDCTILSEEEPLLVTVHGGKFNDFDTRVKIVFNEFNEVLKEYSPKAVFIEGAIYLQNVKTTLMIARMIDMVIANCIKENIFYYIVDNKSWKKDILGNGKATKEQIMSFAKTKWGGIFHENQNLADSSCIAFYGWRRLNEDNA